MTTTARLHAAAALERAAKELQSVDLRSLTPTVREDVKTARVHVGNAVRAVKAG